MKRKWRKRRMMTPRRMRKRRGWVMGRLYDYWHKVMAEHLIDLWRCVPVSRAELIVMGYAEEDVNEIPTP